MGIKKPRDPVSERESEATWDTTELREDFEVLGYQAPFVVVARKSDGRRGSLQFRDTPRVYFGWQPVDE